MSEAGIAAVNCVALMNPVGLALPFHCTCEEGLKFVPVRPSVKAGPPAVALLGEMEVSVGAWASSGEGASAGTTASKAPSAKMVVTVFLRRRVIAIFQPRDELISMRHLAAGLDHTSKLESFDCRRPLDGSFPCDCSTRRNIPLLAAKARGALQDLCPVLC